MSRDLRILVVDDEEVIRDVLQTLLEKEGCDVTTASDAGEALALFDAEPYDVVLLDLMLPDRSGLEVLRDVRRRDPDAVVVIVTAYSSIEGAIQAMREGAFHYIPKPFQNQEVLMTVRKGAEARRLTEENRRLKEELSRRYGLGRIVGKSEGMRKVFELVRLAGPSKSTILVEGESGTGKELVARAIHTHSPRSGAPFVTVNSGSMPTDLLESNLFGHVRGAFTGAVANKKGLFEVAEGGSIFFDEIGTISLETQAKLLRVIQEKEFMRVGSVDTQKADVRIIAATNVDLKKMVADARFRDDLYYRLCVITIAIPPLRDRKEDIPMLAEHFVRLYASENSKPISGIDADAMKALLDYDWPGNVRELENAIERAVVLCPEGSIPLELLPESVLQGDQIERPVRLPENGSTYKNLVEEYERRLVRTALRRTGGVQKRAAELLRMKPTTLHEIIKRLEIRE
ncbi:MAG: sigma-54-dependent Fis family transcriptional regulator [Thermoanaerobaculia bacterium]|nr:sigma-54-dependent Fis family transcriptional regulator [Thermoanaerobaculia bacterium]